MLLFYLFLPSVIASSLREDFIDQARQYLYKMDTSIRNEWMNSYLQRWNKLINVTADVPKVEPVSVDNLTISDVPDWIPSDYDVLINLLKSRVVYNHPKQLPEGKKKELHELGSKMLNTYLTAKVCSYDERENSECMPDMQLEEIRSTTETRNEKELRYYWEAFRDKTGKNMRKDYPRYVELANEAARLNGLEDVGRQWREKFETECFGDIFDSLWDEIRPLYEQLHAYVRRKLIQKYGGIIKPRGPIPAHLLTYTMEEMWLNINSFTRPYPDEPTLDITDALRRKSKNATDMAKIVDDFFVSLGMSPMNSRFWKESVLEKPTDRLMDCYPLTLMTPVAGEHRTRFCTLVRLEDLFVLFHEFGHVHYIRECEPLNLLQNWFPNSALHEAIGGAVALSALNPIYLSQIGLLDDFVNKKEQEINFLYMIALMRLGTLSHMYTVDRWRMDMFDGAINETELNTKWWKYRLQYQGHCPINQRTEDDFDAGAMYLVARNVPSIRYFIAGIFEFQFHKAMCDAAGHTGPLHKCTNYNSTAAGDLFKSMLRLGASVPWRSAVKNMTGTDQIDVQPLLEYFQPLMDWLKEQNVDDDSVGWEQVNSNICP